MQTEQALRNLETALAAGGAGLGHVVKWNIYVVHGQSVQTGLEAFQKVWGAAIESTCHQPSLPSAGAAVPKDGEGFC